MRRPSLVAILSIASLLGTVCPTMFAQEVVPGSVLHLDAKEQNGRDKTWTNLGLAGGEIPTATGDQTPNLKDGEISIPEIGFNRDTKWYTARGVGQAFASVPGRTTRLELKDWTFEFLARRNGAKWPGLVLAAEFAGFHSENRQNQGVRIVMHGGDTGKLTLWMKGRKSAKGKWFGANQMRIDIGEDEWHWIAFVFTNRETLETYQDGKKVGTIETDQNFDDEDSVWATVFSAWDHRAFNGSISIVRIYDRPLSERELNQNIAGDLAVNRINKVATTWAKVKAK